MPLSLIQILNSYIKAKSTTTLAGTLCCRNPFQDNIFSPSTWPGLRACLIQVHKPPVKMAKSASSTHQSLRKPKRFTSRVLVFLSNLQCLKTISSASRPTDKTVTYIRHVAQEPGAEIVPSTGPLARESTAATVPDMGPLAQESTNLSRPFSHSPSKPPRTTSEPRRESQVPSFFKLPLELQKGDLCRFCRLPGSSACAQ